MLFFMRNAASFFLPWYNKENADFTLGGFYMGNRNKYLKTIAALLLCFAMLFASACGKAQPAPSQPSAPAEEPTKSIEDEEPVDKPDSPSAPAAEAPEAEAPDPMEQYQLFLDGKIKTELAYDLMGLSYEDTALSIKELADVYISDLTVDEHKGAFLGDVYYAYIDCGADGVPELAVEYEIIEDYIDYTSPYYQCVIIKSYDDALRIIDDGYTAYRTQWDINEYGYVTDGGSNSAMSLGFSEHYINASGEKIFLYSGEYNLGFAEPVIPYYYLPQEWLTEDYPMDIEFSENGYGIDVYNFEPYEEYEEESYNEHQKQNMFVITDMEANDVELGEYEDLYAQMGVTIYKSDDMDALLNQHCDELGATQQIRDGGAVDWTLLEADWLPKG